MDDAAARAVGHDQRRGRRRVVGQRADLAGIRAAADDGVEAHAGGGDRRLPARRRDQQAGGARPGQDRGVIGGEVDGVELAQQVPRQRIVGPRVQRLTDHRDRALAGRIDHDEVAGVGGAAPRGVHGGGGAGELVGDERRGVVVAERGEQVDLGVAGDQLPERDAAATAGDGHRRLEVGDVAGLRDRRDPAQRDVLDVADHGDAEAARHPGSLHGTPGDRTTSRDRTAAPRRRGPRGADRDGDRSIR
ncbi:MAG: hypothetical protein H6708_32340 [Kofleriaceae bacterium]|nr:hypothetical protein [Kofleriaceae bacterium]